MVGAWVVAGRSVVVGVAVVVVSSSVVGGKVLSVVELDEVLLGSESSPWVVAVSRLVAAAFPSSPPPPQAARDKAATAERLRRNIRFGFGSTLGSSSRFIPIKPSP